MKLSTVILVLGGKSRTRVVFFSHSNSNLVTVVKIRLLLILKRNCCECVLRITNVLT